MPGLPNSKHGWEDQRRNAPFENVSFLFALHNDSESPLN